MTLPGNPDSLAETSHPIWSAPVKFDPQIALALPLGAIGLAACLTLFGGAPVDVAFGAEAAW